MLRSGALRLIKGVRFRKRVRFSELGRLCGLVARDLICLSLGSGVDS